MVVRRYVDLLKGTTLEKLRAEYADEVSKANGIMTPKAKQILSKLKTEDMARIATQLGTLQASSQLLQYGKSQLLGKATEQGGMYLTDKALDKAGAPKKNKLGQNLTTEERINWVVKNNPSIMLNRFTKDIATRVGSKSQETNKVTLADTARALQAAPMNASLANALIKPGIARVLGAQTFSHGATTQTVDTILGEGSKGLDPSFGGSTKGATRVIIKNPEKPYYLFSRIAPPSIPLTAGYSQFIPSETQKLVQNGMDVANNPIMIPTKEFMDNAMLRSYVAKDSLGRVAAALYGAQVEKDPSRKIDLLNELSGGIFNRGLNKLKEHSDNLEILDDYSKRIDTIHGVNTKAFDRHIKLRDSIPHYTMDKTYVEKEMTAIIQDKVKRSLKKTLAKYNLSDKQIDDLSWSNLKNFKEHLPADIEAKDFERVKRLIKVNPWDAVRRNAQGSLPKMTRFIAEKAPSLAYREILGEKANRTYLDKIVEIKSKYNLDLDHRDYKNPDKIYDILKQKQNGLVLQKDLDDLKKLSKKLKVIEELRTGSGILEANGKRIDIQQKAKAYVDKILDDTNFQKLKDKRSVIYDDLINKMRPYDEAVTKMERIMNNKGNTADVLAMLKPSFKDVAKSFIKGPFAITNGLNTIYSKEKGKANVIAGVLPYEEFNKRFELDLDDITYGGSGYRTVRPDLEGETVVDMAERLGVPVHQLKDDQLEAVYRKNLAQVDKIPNGGVIDKANLARGEVSYKQIWDNRSRKLGQYIKKAPKRFLTGTAMLGGAGLLGYQAYRQAKPMVSKIIGKHEIVRREDPKPVKKELTAFQKFLGMKPKKVKSASYFDKFRGT